MLLIWKYNKYSSQNNNKMAIFIPLSANIMVAYNAIFTLINFNKMKTTIIKQLFASNNKTLTLLLVFFTCLLGSITTKAQNNDVFIDSAKVTIDVRNINIPFLERVIIRLINEERVSKGLQELSRHVILNKTAYDQALFMSDFGTLEQSDPGERAILYGGTRNVSEILGRASISPTKKTSYMQAGQLFFDKWKANAKFSNLYLDKGFTFIGVSVSIDPFGEKYYASVDLGNNNSIAPVLDKSSSKYISSKFFGLQPYNTKTCTKCNKFGGVNQLANNIVIEDNAVYFVSDNLKKIKQLLKNPEDGFAIDVVNRNQFACGKDNIINYMVPNKGILLKPILSEEFFRLNSEDPKSNKIKVKLGVLPKDAQLDSIECNLVIVIQGIICKDLYKTKLIAITETNPFDIPVTYLKEANDYTPFDFTKKNIKKKTIDSVVISAQNPKWIMYNKQYDCLCAYIVNDYSFDDADYNRINQIFDKVKIAKKDKIDTLQLIEMSFLMKIASSAQTTQLIKDVAMVKLKAIDPFDLPMEKLLSLYGFFAKNGEYETALSWLDGIILSDAIPQDFLFSYITLSTLYPQRVNSGTFALLISKAKSINTDRFCSLFKPKNFSFQLFENQNVKALVCNSCSK